MGPPLLKSDSKLGQGEYDINGNRSFNNWTRIHSDTCSYENSLRTSSQPMKYYVNEFNSPQVDPFQTYSVVGNMTGSYSVRNDFERPLPSRLNPIYQTYTNPYKTTAYLANQAENRTHVNTGTELRFGPYLRNQKSSNAVSEVDYNRWEPAVSAGTVQNAGQFGSNGKIQSSISREGVYDPLLQNNVLVANSAYNRTGISSRNELHNFVQINNC